MVNNVEDKGLDDEHPLSLEISSLKSALSRFQAGFLNFYFSSYF